MMIGMRMLISGLLVLAACNGGGDDDSALPIDGPVDAPGFNPQSQVRVIVRDRIDRPVAGADVWTHSITGSSLLDTDVTDASGEAIVDLPLGGAVTVHNRESEGQDHWRSVLAVEAGEEVHVVIAAAGDYDPPDPLPTVTAPITLPAGPAGTTGVGVRSACASGQASAAGAGEITSSCSGPVTLIAVAAGPSNTTLGYLVIPDVTIADGVPITSSDAWDTAPPSWTLDVQNVHPAVRYVSAQRYVEPLRHHEGGFIGHYDHSSINNLTAVGATRAAIRPDDDGAPVYHAVSGPYNGGYRFTIDTSEQPLDRFTVDMATLASPAPLTYAPSGKDFTWTAVPGADVLVISLVVAEGTGDVIGPTSSWTVTAPPGLTSFEFFGGLGFPFAATTEPPTRLYAVGVRAYKAAWFPDYAQLRLAWPALDQRPAAFTTTTSYDGFSIYNPES